MNDEKDDDIYNPSFLSNHAFKVQTIEAHENALKAWKQYAVASWGGAMLRMCWIAKHEGAIEVLKQLKNNKE